MSTNDNTREGDGATYTGESADEPHGTFTPEEPVGVEGTYTDEHTTERESEYTDTDEDVDDVPDAPPGSGKPDGPVAPLP